ncbi:MAG: outer membrane protein assembly factor BamD [Holosporales bacterium]|jgi:outer membrane protein assembly factor BamD|nr:outer membrane protein assembly factor BamD [Holosporales bacterium]
MIKLLNKRRALFTVLIISFGGLTACQTAKDATDRPLVDLYQEAYNHFLQKEYKTAANAFEEVERQHPYSAWAIKSQLMSAFCYYMVKDYESAQRALSVFIQYHPTHRDIAYAHYLKGMCLFMQISSPDRDPKPAREAREAFLELSRRFPESSYARDAIYKAKMLGERLASHEICVGRFYERVGDFLAALTRFRTVLLAYPETRQSEEAAYRTIECYISIGLLDEARATEKTLQNNVPKSVWAQKAARLLSVFSSPKS